MISADESLSHFNSFNNPLNEALFSGGNGIGKRFPLDSAWIALIENWVLVQFFAGRPCACAVGFLGDLQNTQGSGV